MKVFISGLKTPATIEDFKNAESLLLSMDMQPVNPIEDNITESWEKQLLKDSKLLFDCDAILMLTNWVESKKARIEKHIAEELNLVILYESTFTLKKENLKRIQEAIFKATHLRFESYISRSQKRDMFFAKMIFARLAKEYDPEIDNSEIGLIINRDRTSVYRYLTKYDEEYKLNKNFRDLVENVNKNLIINVL